MHEILKLLSDPTRYKIINLLLVNDYCVGKLSKLLGISESAVSQHLKCLREAGLISGEKRGYFMHYKVERVIITELAEQLVQMVNTPQMISKCHDLNDKGCSCCRKGSNTDRCIPTE